MSSACRVASLRTSGWVRRSSRRIRRSVALGWSQSGNAGAREGDQASGAVLGEVRSEVCRGEGHGVLRFAGCGAEGAEDRVGAVDVLGDGGWVAGVTVDDGEVGVGEVEFAWGAGKDAQGVAVLEGLADEVAAGAPVPPRIAGCMGACLSGVGVARYTPGSGVVVEASMIEDGVLRIPGVF